MKTGICFRQSVDDFPLTVSLEEKTPSWGLQRWRGNRGLRFVPPDDEGFTVRGDKKRLVYKGRRRSHRFTILGDNAFEYDCILNREPESNVVTLLMEGAESFDFLRQPDFVPDPFLKGSYAVYKKETLIGEGTGKLCHIHRPLIIDAKGRQVWGDLYITGNCLYITIPENWLSEASYPVVVDPTIGTTTIGSQTHWEQDPGEPWVRLSLEEDIPVSRFLVSQPVNGICTAFFYTEIEPIDAGGYPVLYSDNSNRPHLKRSNQENHIDFRVNHSNPKGWRSGSFVVSESIPAGTHIWFGCLTKYIWYPRFDFGGSLYQTWNRNQNIIPDIYPLSFGYFGFPYRLSMYFTYSLSQNYVRTLTQGVSITDSKVIKTDFKRNMTEKVQANTTIKKLQTFYRGLCEAVHGLDKFSSPVLFYRTVQENITIKEFFLHTTVFLRGLFDNAEIESEVKTGRTYLLTLNETVQATGFVFRGLLLFVSITTRLFVRDYVLSRFLKARQEIVLKSCICREITMESKI